MWHRGVQPQVERFGRAASASVTGTKPTPASIHCTHRCDHAKPKFLRRGTCFKHSRGPLVSQFKTNGRSDTYGEAHRRHCKLCIELKLCCSVQDHLHRSFRHGQHDATAKSSRPHRAQKSVKSSRGMSGHIGCFARRTRVGITL